MIERLATKVSPDEAAYLANLLTAAFFAVALLAVALRVLRRGPVRGLEASVS